jgi:alpha-1,3-rhamnosyl/mannosyltransferase
MAAVARSTRSRPLVALYTHQLTTLSATGIGRYVQELAAAVAALTQPSEHSSERSCDVEYRLAASPDRRGRTPAISPLPLDQVPLPRRPLHLAWTLSNYPRVDRFIGRPDLVHVLYPHVPLPTKARLIYTIHDLMPILHPEWYTRKECWVFERSISQATERSHRLIANSNKTKADLISHLQIAPERIAVVPVGVADRFFQPVDAGDIAVACRRHGVSPGRYAIVVGTVSTRKNLFPLVEAVARLRDRGQVRTLLAVGPEGIGFDQVEQQITRLQAGDLVRLTGWLADGDLIPLLAGATALLHPSVDEGFGMTPVEAMAMGVPCAVSSAGSIPDVVGDSALLIDPHDVNGWADAITALFDDDGLRSSLVDKGRATAATFTWQRVAKETMALHRECLAVQA